MSRKTRRAFLRDLGLTAGALPFILNLPSLGFANTLQRKQRLVIMFSPNGVVPWNFWPDETGAEFTVKEILKPLEPYKQRMLVLHGVCNKIRGDGDNHMRGMACLLTGIELFPGNVQGGSHTPAGWAKGLSIDQEIARYLQSKPETSTRFGSLEFGIGVPDRADPWTRLVYAGPNRPVAPVMDPYQMLNKLYGQTRDQESLGGILDDVQDDLHASAVPSIRKIDGYWKSTSRSCERWSWTCRRHGNSPVTSSHPNWKAASRTSTTTCPNWPRCRSICWSTVLSPTSPEWPRCRSPIPSGSTHAVARNRRRSPRAVPPFGQGNGVAGEAYQDQQVVLRANGLPGPQARRNARAGRSRHAAG